MNEESQPERSRRRPSRRQRADQPWALNQLPWQLLRNPYAPLRVISDDQLESIHLAALTILEEIGVDFLLPEAREILQQAGAEVSPGGARVRFDRDLIESAIANAPARFTIHARNPARNLVMGGDALSFSPVGSAPNCSDLERGRRPGNQADYRDFLRLCQQFNILHLVGGYPVEPVDLHPSIRHLECLYDAVTLTDKAFHAYSLGRERNVDALEITRIARGISEEQLTREPSLITVINSSSPLRIDAPMLRGIIEMAARNQVVVMTPFTLAGAMAPVTLAGALAQQNAEALAGIAFAQTVRPGAPVMYGGFTSNVDMKSGAPAFGTPEYMQAAAVGGQLARRYGIPYRSSNTNAANIVDAQAAYESVFSLWGAVMGGANFILHAAGWMEGGLCASFEKLVLDVDLLQMIATFLTPMTVDDATLALAAIREVGPGGHFFGAAHTQERYRTAFYAPLISDWRNFESWREAGAPDAPQRAHRLYKQILAGYEPPPLAPAIKDELDAFIAKRKEAGGVPTDF